MSPRSVIVLLIAVVVAVLGVAPAWAAPKAERDRGGTARHIVVFKDDVAAPLRTTRGLEKRLGFRSSRRFTRVLHGFAGRLTRDQVRQMKADDRVAYVAPDRRKRIGASTSLATGELAPTGVRRVGAATTTTTRQASTVGVAVLDTGIDLDHPDLNVVDARNCTGSGSADDDNGHGTHVAGSIGARNTGAGVVGIVPGTTVYALKVLDAEGSGFDSQIICGLDWVAANASTRNIRVANLSLGGPGAADDDSCGSTARDPLHAAICRTAAARVTPVVAAGNAGVDFAADSPATYSEALTVTAMSDSDGASGARGAPSDCGESDDTYASFSNFATLAADVAHAIAAPGVCITSTYPGGRYARISGTSMAAPHVAGLVAACHGEAGESGPCTGLTPAQIIAKLRSDAEARTTADPAYGFTGDPLRPVAGRAFGFLATFTSASTAAAAPSPAPQPTATEPAPAQTAPSQPAPSEPAPAPAPAPAPSPSPSPAPVESPAPRIFTTTLRPTAYRILSGGIYRRRGSRTRLNLDDGVRLELTSRRSGARTRAEFSASTRITGAQRAVLKQLSIDVDANVSTGRAALGVRIYNFARRRFETIVAPRTGITRDRLLAWQTSSSPRSYVSSTGEIRVAVRATRSGSRSVRSRTDRVRFTIRY